MSALGTVALCVILRTLSIFFAFDLSIGYYKTGAPMPILLNVLTFLAVVAAFAFCFIPKISISPFEPALIKPVRMSAIFPTVGFAAYAFVYVTWLLDYLKYYPTLPMTYILTLASTLGAGIFFACAALRKNNGDVLFILLGILAIVYFVISLADCYFDTLVQMNSPNKLVFQFACLGAMLLTVNEIRQGFDVKRNGFHLFSATVASIFLFTSSIPSILGYVAGKMPISYSLFYSDAVFFMLAIFAVVRLVQMCFIEPPVIDEPEDENTDEQSADSDLTATDSEEAIQNSADEPQGEENECE